MPIPFKGALAQLVEHLTFNQVVERSNRSRPTIFSFRSLIITVNSTTWLPGLVCRLFWIKVKPILIFLSCRRKFYFL